jgi:hypothetical protein
MNDGSCTILTNKDGTMVRVSRENRMPISLKKKDNEVMKNYVDDGIGNYVVLSKNK